ncbi:hypothetical protein A1F94_001404 [Pyrenophora tritici-repentis]|nr:hypothetical protein A1F94_001404 [Pyrenophora tritici-repentis]
MAATESSSLVTKTTVILEKPSDWQEWLFLRRDKATLNGIWEYCNPDMSQHELKKLIEPVRPTPATVAEGVTLRSQLTHEQRLDYQDLLDAWEYDQKTYLHRQKALNELTSEIAQTTARSNLYLLEGKSTAYERLKALKEHLSPNTARRSRELVVKYRDLQATRRGRAVEGWLDDWIKITDQMRTLNLPDVNGSRSQEDFLIAVKPLDDAWATMTLTDLLAKDEAGTPVPSLRDYVSKFRTFHSRTSPRAAGIGTFSATLGMADTNGGHKQRKPKCFCGEYHLFIECKYCNPKLREDGWQGDKDIFEAKERAKKHPKLKDYILRAEKGQGPSKKRPEMTSSKNGTASSSTSTPTPIRFDDDQLATSPIQTNALIQTFNTATTKVPHLMNRWVLDPGSNAHAKPGEVIYAGGQVVQIAEWGTVVLNVRTPSGKAPIKLTHVALVEGFFANVLGLSRCRPLGIHFDSGRDLLYQNNPSNVVAMLEYSNGHWLIDAEENDRPELSTLSTFAARFQPQRTSQKPRPAIVATANEAHQHASKQAIDHLPESVTGFELVGDNKAPKWKDCDILDIPTPQALIDIEDLLSPLQKQTYEENNSLTQNDRNDAETATEKDIQFELGNLDKEFDNSATPESTIRVRHPDDSPTTPESMVSRRQNVPGGWGDQYQDYVPDRYQNNAPRRLNPEVGSQENVIEGHRRRHRANYSDHNHLSTNMTYYSTFLAAISQPETTKLFGELPKVRLYRDQLPPPPKRYRDVATHPFANEFQKAMNVE